MPAKISFGIIVLNGEPFTRYCINALYQHAYEILIVEGACEGARGVANPEGHSRDGTLEILRKTKDHEDPENKITIITAEDEGHPNGFWPGEKDELSRAYAKRATGNYLWQVDIDEFYRDEDIELIKRVLENDPDITSMSFKQQQFWGGFDYLVDSWLLKRGAEEFHRLFKWGQGFEYISHRPPTVINDQGADTRKLKWLRAKHTKKMGIYLYHYSFVFPKQVTEKADYYKNAEWSQRKKADWWANEVFMKLEDPFSVFSVYWDISWLKRFKGKHPAQILLLVKDIENGILPVQVRQTIDIEKLLKSPAYRLKKTFYIILNPFEEVFTMYKKSAIRKFKKLFYADPASKQS
jgi:hypothetical protein